MAQLSCSFTSLRGNKCDISSRWPVRQQLVSLSSCVDSTKEHLRDVSQTSVASKKELILARVDSDLQQSASIPFMEIKGERMRGE